MTKNILNVLLIALVATGCAIGGGATASRHTYNPTNGQPVSTEIVHTAPFIAWGDARQIIANQKVSNTKSGNTIGQSGFEQEVTTTNLPANIRAAGPMVGDAVKTILGVP